MIPEKQTLQSAKAIYASTSLKLLNNQWISNYIVRPKRWFSWARLLVQDPDCKLFLSDDYLHNLSSDSGYKRLRILDVWSLG